MKKLKISILGASGYIGFELIKILLNHNKIEISSLIANNNVGQEISELYPSLDYINLPKLCKFEDIDFLEIDVVFCCLPHTKSQEYIKNLLEIKKLSHLKIIDLSADFRLNDINSYKYWYKNDHKAPNLQKNAIYGLSEINRDKIKKANLIACPGCYPTSILLPILPLLDSKLIDANNIIIDSKSGLSGSGRSLEINNLFCESNESVSAYGISSHRHISEIEQEILLLTKNNIKISFTPHLIPMDRGILSTIYVDLSDKVKINDVKNCLRHKYDDEYFVNITDEAPATKDVSNSNFCKIAIFPSRKKNSIIIISVIDNLIKGASGQAIQNMNILFGFDERDGLN